MITSLSANSSSPRNSKGSKRTNSLKSNPAIFPTKNPTRKRTLPRTSYFNFGRPQKSNSKPKNPSNKSQPPISTKFQDISHSSPKSLKRNASATRNPNSNRLRETPSQVSQNSEQNSEPTSLMRKVLIHSNSLPLKTTRANRQTKGRKMVGTLWKQTKIHGHRSVAEIDEFYEGCVII